MVKRFVIVGLIVALCIMATPVLAAYSCDPTCEPNPDGSDKCCFGEGTPISNNGVTPDAWNDNPTCEDLGFDNGVKFDPPTPATAGDFLWNFDPADPFVTWSSTHAVNAVIMKGGEVGANVYHYSQPSLGDSGLATPVNPSGQRADLSHIDFCFFNCACDDGNECTADGCDDTGACSHIILPPGTECSTGECDAGGNCGGGCTPTSCDDGNPCTADSCNTAGACVHENLPVGTDCGNGNTCDASGNCGGVPVPEFPTLALPAALVIGLVGLVYAVKNLK